MSCCGLILYYVCLCAAAVVFSMLVRIGKWVCVWVWLSTGFQADLVGVSRLEARRGAT